MKIKLFVFFITAFMVLTSKGQAIVDSLRTGAKDSTQIKLEQYKKLLDAGVIGGDEYNKMKDQLQSVPPQVTVVSDSSKVSDSTQIKLEQYKKLLDTGVISEDEYAKLKAQLMGSPIPETKQEVKPDVVISKADTMSISALKDRYKSKIVAGSVILSVGAGFLVGDVLMATLSPAIHPTDTLYSEKVSTRRGSEIALGVLGGVATIGGTVFLALGLKDKAIYKRRGKELTMNFTGKEIEIAFVF